MALDIQHFHEIHFLEPFYILTSLLFLILLLIWPSISKLTSTKNPPPSPPKLPIIGNLHQLGGPLHRTLYSLSQKYGKFMLLHFGKRPTLVISSADGAKEIMKDNDLIFANRPNQRFVDRIFYNSTEVAFAAYGEQWRHLRSISVIHLLSNKKVHSLRSSREEHTALIVEKIKSYGGDLPLNFNELIQSFTQDVICATSLGKKFTGEEGRKFFDFFDGISHVMVKMSVGDCVPWLGWVDKLTGLEGMAENVFQLFDEFIEKIIHEKRKGYVNGEGDDKDFLDILLELHRKNPADLPLNSVKGIILDIFLAGTESTSQVPSWAMTELIMHPEIMKKLQAEVRSIVKPNTIITEDDLEGMTYLKAVIKETLRLHPPAPLLLFHECSQDVIIGGYDIAAGTQVIINAWAIQRDAAYWEEPEVFRPERFLNSSIDFRGQNMEFIPFGAGRRVCPGLSYSIALVERVMASLVNEFDWKLPGEMKIEDIDITEAVGITLRVQHPLSVIAIPVS